MSLEPILAWRSLAVALPSSTQAERAADGRHAEVLYSFAKACCVDLRLHGMPESARQVAIATVIMRHRNRGPRGARDADPSTEEQLRYWFRVCASRELLSMAQSERRATGSLDPLPDKLSNSPAAEPATGGLAFDDSEEQALQVARARYQDAVELARAAKRDGARERFDATLGQLVHICTGGDTIAGMAKKADATRQAFDQRLSRCRQDIVTAAQIEQQAGRWTAFEVRCVEAVVKVTLTPSNESV